MSDAAELLKLLALLEILSPLAYSGYSFVDLRRYFDSGLYSLLLSISLLVV
jgi:hypothetical protein